MHSASAAAPHKRPHPTMHVVQAAALLALSSPVAFVLTVFRFQSPQLRLPGLFATLIFSLAVCGGYRTTGAQIWKLPLYL